MTLEYEHRLAELVDFEGKNFRVSHHPVERTHQYQPGH